MKLIFEKAAQKGLDKMSDKAAKAMRARLDAIALDPHKPHANIKPLSGHRNRFRLRQGDWRAVYELEWTANEMRVILVEVSGSVYR